MMALPKKFLSIDIGSERIKIAHIQNKGKKLQILGTILIPTPANSIKDGTIHGQEELTGVIRNALMTEKIKEKNVIFSISSSKVITREVELPYLKPKKMKNIIRMNAEEYFPVKLEDYCMDYTVTDVVESEEGKKAKVNIFAAHSGLVNQYVELAENCRLNICNVDYSGNSVVSYILNEKYEGTNLFLDIGAGNTMVTIMSKNVVKFSRNLLFGTKLINESIMNHFEVDYDEATKISKERQLLKSEREENTYLSNDVTGGMDQILNGVSRLVDYYTSRNKLGVEKIYLLGGGAEIYGVEDYVEKFFNVKAEKIEAPQSLSFKEKQRDEAVQLYFPTAIGSSLSTINLLPDAIKNRELEATKRRLPYLIILFIIVAMAAFYYNQYTNLQKLQRQKSSIESQIADMQEIVEIKAEYESLVEKEAFRRTLDQLSTRRSDEILSLIQGLERTMPKESFITSLTDSEQMLTLEYTVSNEATLAQLLTYLKGISGVTEEGEMQPLFSDVYTGTVVRIGEPDDGASYVTASIQCTYFEMEVDEQ